MKGKVTCLYCGSDDLVYFSDKELRVEYRKVLKSGMISKNSKNKIENFFDGISGIQCNNCGGLHDYTEKDNNTIELRKR